LSDALKVISFYYESIDSEVKSMNHGLATTDSELKKGYQQNEFGGIPEDWITTNLGEFISLQRGYDLPHRDRKAGDIPGTHLTRDTLEALTPAISLS
jgi:hypothetical protein